MKTNLSIIFFLILSTSLRGEELITLWFEHCLKKSTHIFKASIIDSSGTVMIHELLKGKSNIKTMTLPDFEQAKDRFSDYLPDDGLPGWELILFMQEDSLQKELYHPVNYFDTPGYRDFELALSIIWLRDGEAYYSFQPSNPGPVVFGSWGSDQRYFNRIEAYRKFEKKLKRVNRKKTCRKKMKLLSKMYTKARNKSDVYQKIKELSCKKEQLSFIEKTMYSESSYHWIRSTAMEDFISMDKERADRVLDEVFKKEFAFWQNHINNNPKDKWWLRDNPNYPRFTFFWRLVASTIHHKLSDWKEKGTLVKDYFSQVENYGRTDGFKRIDKQVEYLFGLEKE